MEKEKGNIGKILEFWFTYLVFLFTLVLIVHVTTTFHDVISSFGDFMPIPARIVCGVNQRLKPFDNWWSFIIGAVIIYLGFNKLSKTKHARIFSQ